MAHRAEPAQHWLFAPGQLGGTGADLAEWGVVAVHPIGGWWTYNKRRDRTDLPVRYGLLLSLRSREQGVDLYAPIAAQIALPVETVVPAT